MKENQFLLVDLTKPNPTKIHLNENCTYPQRQTLKTVSLWGVRVCQFPLSKVLENDLAKP